MTDIENSTAQQILATIGQPAGAEVNVHPAIPPHIAGNLLEFLRRVQSTGMEAVAWVEAYQFVQKHVSQQPPK